MTAAYAQLAVSMILVGLNVAVLKVLATELPVAVILALRCALATAVLLPWAWRDGLRVPPRALLNLGGQAVLGTLLYNVTLILGVSRTGALEAGLVLATLPAVVAVGALLFLREALTTRRVAAALLAGGGMAVLALGRGGEAHGALLGDVFVLGAVAGEAGYMLLAKVNTATVPPVVGAFWMQAVGTLLVAPAAAWSWDGAAFGAGVLGLVAFHGITASVLAPVLWYMGLRRVPGGVAGVFAGLLPLTAGVASVGLGEVPTLAHGAGAALMLGSIALATWPSRTALTRQARPGAA